MEQSLFLHYLFHHLQHTAKTTNFMQSKKLMLQPKSSLPGPWRKIITFTKRDLCFGKTCSFPHGWIFQNTSLFTSLFSICKCFQCLKVKFADLLWSPIYNILHALKLHNMCRLLSIFFDCLTVFFVNFQNIILILFNQLVIKY